MNMRFFIGVAAVALGVLTGCRASTALSYETCLYDSDCRVATDRCVTFASASGHTSVRLCSSACSTGTQCPSDRYGGVGTCVAFPGGVPTQCYQTCTAGSSLCEYGTVCTAESGGSICFPPAGSTTVAAYAGCAGGMTCQSGTFCTAVKDATTIDLCTVTHCSTDNDCPYDVRGGRGACVSLDGDSFGTCVERCTRTSDCTYPTVERCTTVTHNGVTLPPPGLCLP